MRVIDIDASTSLERLARLPEIARVPAAARRKVLRHLDIVRLRAGAVILPAGVRVEHLYLVIDGLVSATDESGELAVHGPGQPVELRRLFDESALPGPIVAVTDTELGVMGRRELVSLGIDVPGFAFGLLEASA